MNIDSASKYHSNHKSVLKLDDDDDSTAEANGRETNGCEEIKLTDVARMTYKDA